MNQETIKILFIEGLLKEVDLKELISGEKAAININLIRANNLLEAKKLISKEQVDVIISDIKLSDGAGLDVIDQLKIHFPQLPIIALSDVEDLLLERSIIQKGVQDCLSIKQLNTYNLIRSISYAIERKKNELKRLEKEYSVDNITAPFYLVNSDATLQYVNEATCNYLGYTKEELLSMTIFDFDETFNRECWGKHWQNIKEKGSETVETIHKTKDGNLVNVEINANYFELDGQEFNFAYGFNITKKKIISENLQLAIKELSSNKKEAIKLLEPTLKEKVLSSLTSKKGYDSIKLLDLVDLEDLQKIQDSFAITNEVASVITDLKGNPITEASNFCEVCRLVRQTEKGRRKCYNSDRLLGEKALEKMKPHFESCHSCGFIDAAAPIIVEGKIIAHWLIGQSNVGGVNKDRISAYAEEIGADKDQMLEAYSKMSNMSLDRFKKITELLWLLAQEISSKGYKNLRLAQELKKVRETEQSLKQTIDDLKASEKKLEEKQNELIESQALLQSIIDQAPTGVIVGKVPDMQICIVNKAAAEISGLSIENWSKISIDKIKINYESFYPDGRKYKLEDLPLLRAFRDQEIIKNEEILLKLADGTEKWGLLNATPVYDVDKNLIAATSVFSDITERKKLEEELKIQNEQLQAKEEELISQNEELQAKEEELISQNEELIDKQGKLIESQALLNSILEKAPAGILVGRAPDMKLCISNQAANEITGHTIKDWSKIDNNNISLQFKIFYPDGTPYKEEDLPFVRSFKNLEVVQNEEQLIRLSDGTEKSVLISTTPVFDDNNNLTAAMAIFTDITERKKLEKNLIESQALLQSIIDQAPAGVLACKAPDMELYVTNKAANEITGLKTEKWTTITLNNIDLHYENFYPDKTPYRLDELPLPRAIRDEEVIQNEEIILKLADGTEKWVSVNATPVYDNNNKLIAATAVFADITERKKLEEELINHKNNLEKEVEERTEALNTSLGQLKTVVLRLEQANKHKNQFISSMSHELRTPLNAIIGFTQTLEKEYFGNLNEKQMEYIQLVKTSGEHLLSLINDILNLAKIDSGSVEFTPENIKAEKCISEIVSIMAAQFKDKKVHLGYSVDEDIDLFYSDERKCKQILFNLLSNALKFTNEGGHVNINASKEGEFVCIAVEDNGIGIKQKDIDRVFEEFYQSDEIRDQALGGAGIGLALTQRLVKMHGGEIGVESKEDEGAKFWFTVPVKNDK